MTLLNFTIREELKPRHINVNEVFGPTIQGEGPHMGQRVGFVRLAGCNLSCSWCDTPYSWDWERYDKAAESHPMTIEQVAELVKPMGVTRLVLTGGEPMLQQRFIPALHALTGCLIDVETNGTRAPLPGIEDSVDLFNVSPKLSHAQDPAARRIVDKAMSAFADLAQRGKAVFKFVAEKPEDLQEIRSILDRYTIPDSAVWVMPEGMTIDQHIRHLQELADYVVDAGWNLTTRVHVLAWETVRKR